MKLRPHLSLLPPPAPSRSGLEVLAECARRGVDVHNAAVFGGGLLVGGPAYKYSRDVPRGVRRRLDAWQALARRHGVALPAVAIAFAAAPAAVAMVAVGVATEDEVEQLAGYVDQAARVPTAIWRDAAAEGVLPPEIAELAMAAGPV